MQSVISDTNNLTEEPRPNAEAEGAIDASDTEAVIRRGGQAIEALGNDLGRAASGALQEADIDTARQRVRDCQSALVSLGYSLGDHDDPADGVHGIVDDATAQAISQFQDDNDLDATGIIDRDTYEALLRSFEQALSMHQNMQLEDDFMPMHTSEAVQHTADASDIVDADVVPVDDSEEALLTLRDELRVNNDADLSEDL